MDSWPDRVLQSVLLPVGSQASRQPQQRLRDKPRRPRDMNYTQERRGEGREREIEMGNQQVG